MANGLRGGVRMRRARGAGAGRSVLAHAIGSIVSRARVSALLDIFAAPLFVTHGALALEIGSILSRVRVSALLDTRELDRTTRKTRRPSKTRRGKTNSRSNISFSLFRRTTREAPLFVTRGALAHAIGSILSRARVAAFLDTRELNRTTLKTCRRPSKIRRGSK